MLAVGVGFGSGVVADFSFGYGGHCSSARISSPSDSHHAMQVILPHSSTYSDVKVNIDIAIYRVPSWTRTSLSPPQSPYRFHVMKLYLVVQQLRVPDDQFIN
jgi:hypothetical protein